MRGRASLSQISPNSGPVPAVIGLAGSAHIAADGAREQRRFFAGSSSAP
jgi:hypothetical protein